MAASASGKLFGVLIGAFVLVIVLIIIGDLIVEATNLTGIAATIVSFLPAIIGVVGFALLLKDSGLMN